MAAASERGLITVADGKYRVGNRTGQLGLVGVWPGTLHAGRHCWSVWTPTCLRDAPPPGTFVSPGHDVSVHASRSVYGGH